MPRLSQANKRLISSLKRKYANNGQIRRQIGRGIRALKPYARKFMNNVAKPMAYNMIRGSGDYNISPHGFKGAPHLKHMHGGGHMGRVSGNLEEKGEMIISHSEYVGDLISGVASASGVTGFNAQSYAINPANSALFPWLWSTAVNFQSYIPDKIVVEYRPLVSDSVTAATNALLSMGSVIIATQYDSVLGAYTTKSQMENSDFAVSCKPSEHCIHAIECKSSFNPLGMLYTYVGNNVTPQPNYDLRMNNLGIVTLATQSVPTPNTTTVDVGEIWVHYRFKLYKPVLNAGLTSVLSAHYQINAPTATNLLGTSQTVKYDGIGISFTTPATSNAFTFPLSVTQGSFLITYSCNGNSTVSCEGPTVAVTTAGTGALLQVWAGDAISYIAVPSAGNVETATRVATMFIVNVTAPGSVNCGITFSTAGGLPAASTCDLFITQISTLVVN